MVGTDRAGHVGPHVAVVGASFIDASFHVRDLPPPERTIPARQTWLGAGGKGLNQAVAAARLGAGKVTFVSAIGDDRLGSRYVSEEFFETEECLKRVSPHWAKAKHTPLPVVAITTADNDVRMLATPGGSLPALSTKHLKKQRVRAALLEADVILMTLDYGSAIVREVLDLVRPADGSLPARPDQTVVLNAAPAPFPGEIDTSIFDRLDWLVPNMWEARRLLNSTHGQDEISDMARQLLDLGPMGVCVTAGSEGCVYLTNKQLKPRRPPLYNVVPIDTTGASDAFCAALALCLSEGCDERESVMAASAAGALAAQTFGSSCSMPSREQLASFLTSRGADRKLTKRLAR